MVSPHSHSIRPADEKRELNIYPQECSIQHLRKNVATQSALIKIIDIPSHGA